MAVDSNNERKVNPNIFNANKLLELFDLSGRARINIKLHVLLHSLVFCTNKKPRAFKLLETQICCWRHKSYSESTRSPHRTTALSSSSEREGDTFAP